MIDTTYESIFQADIVSQMQAQGWQVGHASGYQSKTALYEQDVLDFVQTTQPKEWEKFCRTFPIDYEQYLLEKNNESINPKTKVYLEDSAIQHSNCKLLAISAGK